MVRSPHLSRIPYRSLFVAVALDPRRIDAAVQHRKDVGDVEYFGSLLYEGMSSDEEAEDADDEADDDENDEGDGAGAGTSRLSDAGGGLVHYCIFSSVACPVSIGNTRAVGSRHMS